MDISPTSIQIELFPGGLLFCGKRWTGQISSEEFKGAIMLAPRCEVIMSRNVPWRRVLYYDPLGIYALEDVDEERIAYMGFAFMPEYSAFKTDSAFMGDLMINEHLVKHGMTARDICLKGSMNFVRGIGATWKFVHDNCYVELKFRRLKMRNRSTRTEAVLSSVTHSFLKD